MPYGYLGTTPNQQILNSGVFSVEEALAVQNKGEWGGSLKLITSGSADNSSQTLDFSDCFTNKFNVYLIQWKDFRPQNDENFIHFRLKNASGEISSGYHRATQEGNVNGSFSEIKSTSSTYIRIMGGIGTSVGEQASGYIYIYNPNDSSKFTYTTNQSTYIDQNGVFSYIFGGAVHPTAETITGAVFRSISTGGTLGNINKLDVSIFGVKQI